MMLTFTGSYLYLHFWLTSSKLTSCETIFIVCAYRNAITANGGWRKRRAVVCSVLMVAAPPHTTQPVHRPRVSSCTQTTGPLLSTSPVAATKGLYSQRYWALTHKCSAISWMHCDLDVVVTDRPTVSSCFLFLLLDIFKQGVSVQILVSATIEQNMSTNHN